MRTRTRTHNPTRSLEYHEALVDGFYVVQDDFPELEMLVDQSSFPSLEDLRRVPLMEGDIRVGNPLKAPPQWAPPSPLPWGLGAQPCMHARRAHAHTHKCMCAHICMHARTHARTQEVVFVDADEDSGLVAIQERAAEACSLPEVTSKGPGARMQVRRSARAQAREARQLTAAVPGCSQVWVFLRDLNPQALAQVVADQLGGTFDAEDTMRHFWEKESEREKLKSKWVGCLGVPGGAQGAAVGCAGSRGSAKAS